MDVSGSSLLLIKQVCFAAPSSQSFDGFPCTESLFLLKVEPMNFEIIGAITDIEIIAVGNKIREIESLRQGFGLGRWRKLKGVASVKLINGRIRLAEVHWYEAHGIGQFEHKIIPPLIG